MKYLKAYMLAYTILFRAAATVYFMLGIIGMNEWALLLAYLAATASLVGPIQELVFGSKK